MREAAGPMASALARVAREPLVAFALAAAALFVLYGAVAPPAEETIRVTPEMIRELASRREEILGRELDAEEREELVSHFVDEEILVREALARGLARRDSKIRHRLAGKMLFLFDQEPPQPSREDLQAFYESRRDQFRTPAAISFEHVFFDSAPEEPSRILETLDSEPPTQPMGDRFWLGETFDRMTEAEVGASFGAAFSGQLRALETSRWYGPLTSAHGTHFVRITARHAPQQVPFAALGASLRQEWLETEREKARSRELAGFRQRYRVVVEIGEEQ